MQLSFTFVQSLEYMITSIYAYQVAGYFGNYLTGGSKPAVLAMFILVV